MRCGRPAWRCRLTGLTPTRVARSVVRLESPGAPRRLVGLAVAFAGGHRLTHHPFARRPGGTAVRMIRVRLGVPPSPVTARSCRINRPLPGTAGGFEHPAPSARRLRPPPPPRMRSGRCHPGRRDASLEVFRPLQRSLAAPRSVRWAAGPPDPPASALPRDTRAFPDDGPVSRNSPLRVCAVLSSDCEVEVLGVADERGWAFRPDRKPTPEEILGTSSR